MEFVHCTEVVHSPLSEVHCILLGHDMTTLSTLPVVVESWQKPQPEWVAWQSPHSLLGMQSAKQNTQAKKKKKVHTTLKIILCMWVYTEAPYCVLHSVQSVKIYTAFFGSLTMFLTSTFAPCLMSKRTISSLPLLHALCSGVSPLCKGNDSAIDTVLISWYEILAYNSFLHVNSSSTLKK